MIVMSNYCRTMAPIGADNDCDVELLSDDGTIQSR